jgi:hypothetical protein
MVPGAHQTSLALYILYVTKTLHTNSTMLLLN